MDVDASEQLVDHLNGGVEGPLAKCHVLGVAQQRVRHVGGVERLPHCPAVLRAGVGNSEEQNQGGVLLLSQVVAGLVAQDGQNNHHVHRFVLDDVLDGWVVVGSSVAVHTQSHHLAATQLEVQHYPGRSYLSNRRQRRTLRCQHLVSHLGGESYEV